MAALAVTGAVLDGRAVGLRAEGGLITELGPDVSPQPGDEILEGAGRAIVPGLVNAHTHAAMTLFRGYADDLPLMEWLERYIWPAEGRLVAEDVYWGTRLAAAEMIRTGTVAFWDMYWQPGATARAVVDAGLRATIAAPLFDGADSANSGGLRADADAALEELAAVGDADGRVAPALAPHAIYTVSDSSLEWVAERAGADGLPIHIHLAETSSEVEDCVRAHGVRPAQYLDRLGVLGPSTLLAHGVWLDDAERELIAERGATLVTNPNANLKLAVGAIFDLPAARAAGIPTALGTDGPGSNNSLDLILEVKQLALLQKHRAGDPATLTAEEALAIAAGSRAPLVAAAGVPAVGAPADFLLVRLDTPALGLGSLAAGLVYAASGEVVDATVVAGRVLMREGRIDEEGEIVARARERAERLGLC